MLSVQSTSTSITGVYQTLFTASNVKEYEPLNEQRSYKQREPHCEQDFFGNRPHERCNNYKREEREPTAMQIFLGCEAPQFNAMQQIIGVLTCVTGGSGLMCGTCCGCYGFERAGCLNVCIAGWCMEMTCYLGYGWLVACLVGMKMMSGTA
ncbi:Transmembrane_domain-containing protein [Hexamita inflata]|uniref:Transmembrane domain-containing protein n=1 Tax=Hexamita inflata TaxID=28002 RepID=A0AA86P9U0_9EUKA|nr:Transmembrane domain-containing protein [Hexamita inflata]